VNILIVCQQAKVQSAAFANRTDSDGTDGRDAISSIPAMVNGRLAARSQGSANSGREHEARFIGEDQVSPSASGVFLYGEILRVANEQFLSRRVRQRGVRASGWSNPTVASECCGGVRDEVLFRNTGEPSRLHEQQSKGCWPSHTLGRLLTEVFPIATVARRSAGVFGREVAWRPSPLDLPAPCRASDTGTDVIHLRYGRLESAIRPPASVAPPADGGVPVLLHFLLVSYMWYRLISSCHLRKTGFNSERIEGWLRRRYMLNPEEIKKAKETVYLVDPEHLKEAR